MELTVFDPEMNALGEIEAISSLVWTRRYQTVGEANLLVPYRDDYAALLVDGNLLMKRGGSEAVQICYCHIAQNTQGAQQLEVRAKTLMSWLDRRILLKQIASSGLTGQQIIRQMITQNVTAPADAARQIPLTGLYARADYTDAVISDYASEEHAAVLDSVEGLLGSAALGLRVLTDATARTHLFDIFRGRDLTTGQDDNQPCVFSAEFDTLGAHSYTHGSEALRNMAYVYGGDADVSLGAGTVGLARREMAVDASDITKDYTDDNGNPATRTAEQLTAALTQRGSEELKKALEELTFEGTLNNAAQTQYGEDFDIGDRVTCQNHSWGVALDVRITEVTETFQGNKAEITVTFGEGTPSLKNTVRQMAKGR